MAKKVKNFFENARKANEEKKPKGAAQISGLRLLACVDYFMEAVKSFRATCEDTAKTSENDVFVVRGMEEGKQPDNFEGYDDNATASCQLRQRASNRGLNEEELALCRENGISVEERVLQPRMFGINPKYQDNLKLMTQINTALVKIPGLPDDLILEQEQKSIWVTTEKSIDEVFGIKDANKVRALLKVTSTLAMKTKLENADLAEIGQMLLDTITKGNK